MTPRQWAVVITASIGAMLEVIDVSIVNVALTHIQANLGATLAEVGWVVTGYAMASVVMIPLSEWLGERFGQRNYFVFCLVGFTAASVLCGLAPNLPLLVLARIAQGLLGGGLLPKAQAVMFQEVPKAYQGIAQGVFGIVVLVGPALGPTLGGLLTDALGRRWPCLTCRSNARLRCWPTAMCSVWWAWCFCWRFRWCCCLAVNHLLLNR